MNSLYRVRSGMTKPIKCIALGNPREDTKRSEVESSPLA